MSYYTKPSYAKLLAYTIELQDKVIPIVAELSTMPNHIVGPRGRQDALQVVENLTKDNKALRDVMVQLADEGYHEQD